jgi:hypothetical protein
MYWSELCKSSVGVVRYSYDLLTYPLWISCGRMRTVGVTKSMGSCPYQNTKVAVFSHKNTRPRVNGWLEMCPLCPGSIYICHWHSLQPLQCIASRG